MNIPVEVHDRVMWMFGARTLNGVEFPGIKEVDVSRVSFYAKSKYSRVSAWIETLKCVPMGDQNPWRKCHTEHYWVWFLKHQ